MTIHFDKGGVSQSVAVETSTALLEKLTFAQKLYQHGAKRALDLLFVLAVSPLAILLIGVSACLTAFWGGQPFYTQERLGRNGRVFRMLKIRTMVRDADAVMSVYLAENPSARAEWDAKQKLEEDPRITALGHILRRTSLDELPQLWNVLKGDMSIVGPRPMMVDQAALYPGTEYYALRPGITGPWQVSDRSAGRFSDRARFDREYLHGLSFMCDLRILWKTVGAVLNCTGR